MTKRQEQGHERRQKGGATEDALFRRGLMDGRRERRHILKRAAGADKPPRKPAPANVEDGETQRFWDDLRENGPESAGGLSGNVRRPEIGTKSGLPTIVVMPVDGIPRGTREGTALQALNGNTPQASGTPTTLPGHEFGRLHELRGWAAVVEMML